MSSGDIIIIEDENQKELAGAKPWRILIVDDEEDVHDATRLALRNAVILGRPLEIFSASGSEECLELLRRCDDMAVILLDVVMEETDSGLKLCRIIREDLGLTNIRIILRTGQPGYAPEMEVIQEYDINDYRVKSELTHARLLTSLTAALRSYDQISTIDQTREGLEKVVDATGALLEARGLADFASRVLTQMDSLISQDVEGIFCVEKDAPENQHLNILGATKRFGGFVGAGLHDIGKPAMEQAAASALEKSDHVSTDGVLAVPVVSAGQRAVIIIAVEDSLSDLDTSLIKVFSGNVASSFGNVTQLKQLRELNSELDAAYLAKSRFLADMSHELLTPLNGILGFAELLKAEASEGMSRKGQGYVDTILGAGRHLLDLVKDLLLLGEIESKRIVPAPGPVDCRKLLDEVLAVTAREATERNLTVSCDVVPAELFADAKMVRQALVNILLSRFKNLAPDSRIEIAGRAGKDTIRLSIADNHPPWSEELITTLIDPFVRERTDIARDRPLDLELTVALRLLETMGCLYSIGAGSGNGFHFTIDLPLAQVARPAPAS